MRFKLALPIAVVLPLALIGAGCGSSSGGGDTSTGASSIVPATAPAYIALDTDEGSSQWQAANDLANRFPDKQKAIAAIERDAKKQGLDYENDIKPALGSEVDITWLDFDNNGEDVVVLLQPSDDAAFKRLIAKGNAKDPTNKVLVEKVGDWEAVAEKQTVLDRFAAQSKNSTAMLADDDSFTSAMDSVSKDALFRAYVDGKSVMATARKRGGKSVAKMLDEAGTLDWVVAGAGATSEGVRFDTFVHGTPGKLLTRNAGAVSFHPSLPDGTPGNAILYLAFHGSKGMFSNLGKTSTLPGESSLADAGISSKQLAPFKSLLAGLGTLLQGENALYVRSPPAGSRFPEITLVADPGASVDGAATLDKLLQSKSLGLPPAKAVTISGAAARKLALGGLQIDYANVLHKLIVTDGPGGIEALMNPGSALSKNPDFTDASDGSGLPSQTQGYLYVNVTGGLALGERLANTHLPASIKRDLEPLRSALEYGVSQPSELQITFFLRIK